MSWIVTWPGAVALSSRNDANVRNALNFFARTREISPASPIHRAIVGFWRVWKSSNASMLSRTVRAVQTILLTLPGPWFISATTLYRRSGRPLKSWLLTMSERGIRSATSGTRRSVSNSTSTYGVEKAVAVSNSCTRSPSGSVDSPPSNSGRHVTTHGTVAAWSRTSICGASLNRSTRSSTMSAPASAASAMSRFACATSFTKMVTQRWVTRTILVHARRERRAGGGHEQFDLLLRRLARLPQRQPQVARVHSRDAHRVLDAGRVAVEEHRPHEREQPPVQGAGLGVVAVLGEPHERLDVAGDQVRQHADHA